MGSFFRQRLRQWCPPICRLTVHPTTTVNRNDLYNTGDRIMASDQAFSPFIWELGTKHLKSDIPLSGTTAEFSLPDGHPSSLAPGVLVPPLFVYSPLSWHGVGVRVLLPSYLPINMYTVPILQPFVAPWPFFQFINLYTIGRALWTQDQPVIRTLPTHRTKKKNTINAHRHPCLEWVSNPQPQCLNGRRQFMPQAVHPLWSAHCTHK
jgi:hypothetical protein